MLGVHALLGSVYLLGLGLRVRVWVRVRVRVSVRLVLLPHRAGSQ